MQQNTNSSWHTSFAGFFSSVGSYFGAIPKGIGSFIGSAGKGIGSFIGSAGEALSSKHSSKSSIADANARGKDAEAKTAQANVETEKEKTKQEEEKTIQNSQSKAVELFKTTAQMSQETNSQNNKQSILLCMLAGSFGLAAYKSEDHDPLVYRTLLSLFAVAAICLIYKLSKEPSPNPNTAECTKICSVLANRKTEREDVESVPSPEQPRTLQALPMS